VLSLCSGGGVEIDMGGFVFVEVLLFLVICSLLFLVVFFDGVPFYFVGFRSSVWYGVWIGECVFFFCECWCWGGVRCVWRTSVRICVSFGL